VADHQMIGKMGRVTGKIAPGRLGEVMVQVPGGSEAFHAYSADDDETIPTGSRIAIANSARRFLDQQDQMDARVHNVFAGHLRAIVGSMTVEEMIRDREKLTQLTRESSGMEMEKLGLIVDSLQIQEIDDPTGYIQNLGRPHAAVVASQARIAQAHADREATENDAVIGQQLAEQWPAIVEAAAKPFGAVDQMIVLNGAQGLSEALAQALSSGVAGLQMARSLLSHTNGNGAAQPKAPAIGRSEEPPSQSS
jgi:uncharacterized membrane protein YqiK